MTIKGEVTQEDIKRGCARSSSNCPITRSLARSFAADSDISVGTRTMVIERKVECLPSKFRVFIRKFDDDQPVKPFKYTFTTVHDYELKELK